MDLEVEAIIKVLHYFNWTVFGIVSPYEQDQNKLTEYFSMEARTLKQKVEMRKELEVSCHIGYDSSRQKTLRAKRFLEAVNQLKKCARIVVLLAPLNDVIKILQLADENGMNPDEFVFIAPFQELRIMKKFKISIQDNDKSTQLPNSFKSCIFVTPQISYHDFIVKNILSNRRSKLYDFQKYFYSCYYDAVQLSCYSIKKWLEKRRNPDVDLLSLMKGVKYRGNFIDNNGDRLIEYGIYKITNFSSVDFHNFMVYSSVNETIYGLNTEDGKILWENGKIPKAKPECGFIGDDVVCKMIQQRNAIIISGVVLLISIIIIILLLITWKRKKKVGVKEWEIFWEDIVTVEDFGLYHRGLAKWTYAEIQSRSSKLSVFTPSADVQIESLPNTFQAVLNEKYSVLIHKLKSGVIFNKETKRQLEDMIPMEHHNLSKFYGACRVPAFLAFEFYKGSVYDLISGESIQMDYTFKFLLLMDIVNGMLYIHESSLVFHGNLNSTCCMVDDKFNVKISFYGICASEKCEDTDVRLLWQAPEFLNNSSPGPIGSQKGDVYSFSIIMHEVVNAEKPYYPHFSEKNGIPFAEIAKKIASDENFRPEFKDGAIVSDDMKYLLENCWSIDPIKRPNFKRIELSLNLIRRLDKSQIKANLDESTTTYRMEQYTENIRKLVYQRNKELLEAKQKAEKLMERMLPRKVIRDLEAGRKVPTEEFENATVFCSDIVGFTAFSSKHTPLEVVSMLDKLYTMFDEILAKFDVYKVDTVGDAYQVVSGVPEPNGRLHGREIARMALGFKEKLTSFDLGESDGKIAVRMGVHTGRVTAGVINSKKMPKYALIGITVKVAEEMEQSGEKGRIQVSSATKDLLEENKSFRLVPYRIYNSKIVGDVETFWLEGENVEER